MRHGGNAARRKDCARSARPVLVVEDEAETAEALRELLEDEGYPVIVARGGAEAIAHLSEEHPRLVILDLLMPEVSGNRVYEEIQRTPALASIPVLVTTAEPSRAPQGVPTLAKPFRVAQLLSLVALACGRA